MWLGKHASALAIDSTSVGWQCAKACVYAQGFWYESTQSEITYWHWLPAYTANACKHFAYSACVSMYAKLHTILKKATMCRALIFGAKQHLRLWNFHQLCNSSTLCDRKHADVAHKSHRFSRIEIATPVCWIGNLFEIPMQRVCEVNRNVIMSSHSLMTIPCRSETGVWNRHVIAVAGVRAGCASFANICAFPTCGVR